MSQDHLSVANIVSALLWLFFLLVLANFRKNRVENQETRQYFMLNFWYKIFMSSIFAAVYLFYFGGGDTTAYWDGGVVLNNVMFEDFGHYIESLLNPPSEELRSLHFNSETGYPPGWIYREEEAWFVCKIVSIISLFTFQSYFAGTFVFSYFISIASFNLLERILRLNIHSTRLAAFAVLFVPSVAFWCAGVSKDTITFWSVLVLISIFLKVVVLKEKMKFTQVILVFVAIFLLYHTRVFILAATIAPLAMAYGARITKKYERLPITKFTLRFLLIGISFSAFIGFLGSGVALDLVQEAQIVQEDFQNNAIYTGKRYEIDNTDPTPVGLLSAMPLSIFYGIFKPLPYEALSPTLLFNGLESLFLIVLSVAFLFRGFRKNISMVINQEFLIFCLIFVLFVGFMAGFSSVLFGVLVRIRAPLLPFFFLLLTAQINKKQIAST